MRIEARNVVAGYGRSDVLHDVSFTLNHGEFVGLIGPNGSGKSTLLRVLSGFLLCRTGEVLIDGQPLSALPSREIAKIISFVPQLETALFDFKVRDVVLMGRYPFVKRSKGETIEDYEAALRAMATADILQIADHPITAISGGEHRRVLIARALAQNTPTMFLDEPTAHLDVTHQVEILSAVSRSVKGAEKCGVAALHDLNLAAEFCDRILLMNHGRIVANGAPREVITEELLCEVYGPGLRVASSPLTGGPVVLPSHRAEESNTGLRVHVVCGGGTGTGIIAALVRRGFHVTAGVVNRMDSDETACKALGIVYASEAPFSAIGDEARAAGAALMSAADWIVVAEIPVGKGNLVNLELVLEAQVAGRKVLLMNSTPLEARDFTGGAAGALCSRMSANGAVTVADIAELEHELSH